MSTWKAQLKKNVDYLRMHLKENNQVRTIKSL